MRAWLWSTMVMVGCFDPALPRAPSVLATSADGAGPVDPTAPLAVRLSAPIDVATAESQLVLVAGEPDGRLVAELAHPPLPASTRARLVAARLDVAGVVARLTPRRALVAHARYTLVVGPALRAGGAPLGRAVVRAFSTGEPSAPTVELIDPPDGAAGVVRNLRAVRWRSAGEGPDGAPSHATLVDDAGVAIVSHVGDDGALLLDAPLAANAHYALWVDGAFGDPPGFSTGAELRTTPPALGAVELEAADRCLVARFVTDRAASASLCVGDRCQADGPARTHELGVPLVDLFDGWGLIAGDESSAPTAALEGRVTMPPVPIVITEVLTEPLGPRLRQQFVELTNVGDDAVELGGLVLATPSGADPLPPATLPSGRAALIVTRDFGDDGVDVAPPPDAVIVRLGDGRLGGLGLHVDGEPVWVESSDGTLLTRWGGWPIAHHAGESFRRADPWACDVRASFSTGPPTPGVP